MPVPPLCCQSPIGPVSGDLGACTLAGAIENLLMHKDKPPGIFDLTERSMRYAAGFCFLVGFLISVLVRVAIVLAGEHSAAAPWSDL